MRRRLAGPKRTPITLARYTHALPEGMERARELLVAYLAREAAQACGQRVTLSFPPAFPPTATHSIRGRFWPLMPVLKTGMGFQSIGGSNPPSRCSFNISPSAAALGESRAMGLAGRAAHEHVVQTGTPHSGDGWRIATSSSDTGSAPSRVPGLEGG